MKLIKKWLTHMGVAAADSGCLASAHCGCSLYAITSVGGVGRRVGTLVHAVLHLYTGKSCARLFCLSWIGFFCGHRAAITQLPLQLGGDKNKMLHEAKSIVKETRKKGHQCSSTEKWRLMVNSGGLKRSSGRENLIRQVTKRSRIDQSSVENLTDLFRIF